MLNAAAVVITNAAAVVLTTAVVVAVAVAAVVVWGDVWVAVLLPPHQAASLVGFRCGPFGFAWSSQIRFDASFALRVSRWCLNRRAVMVPPLVKGVDLCISLLSSASQVCVQCAQSAPLLIVPEDPPPPPRPPHPTKCMFPFLVLKLPCTGISRRPLNSYGLHLPSLHTLDFSILLPLQAVYHFSSYPLDHTNLGR